MRLCLGLRNLGASLLRCKRAAVDFGAFQQARARSTRIAARREAAWFAPVSRSDRGREDGVGAGAFAFPFRRRLPVSFRYVGIPAPGQREAVHGDESGKPGRLGKVLSSTSKGFCFSTKSKRPIGPSPDMGSVLADARCRRITLGDHRSYDLSGFYVVCTSNIGSQQLLRPTRLPFTTLERAVISEPQILSHGTDRTLR